MINPSTITTGGITVLEVLRNTGANGYSVARIQPKIGGTYLGIRWNGEPDPSHRGYPTSRGYPVFFAIPEEMEDAFEQAIR